MRLTFVHLFYSLPLPIGGPMSATAPISVLLVEDTPDLLEALQKLLEVAGFVVLEAPDGERAWELFTTVAPGLVAPDILVTDLRLPGLNGLELIRRIRAATGINRLPIIAISGEHDVVLKEAQASGADLVMQKPLEPN